MKRLTGRNNIGEVNSYNPETDYTAGDKEIRLRLSEYEDTDLEPEEVMDYRRMLNKLQFVKDSGRIGGAIYTFCPVCGNTNIQDHKKDCELFLLLK